MAQGVFRVCLLYTSFGNGKRLEIYTEIEADMKTPEEINKEGYPYTYIQMDERGVAQYLSLIHI